MRARALRAYPRAMWLRRAVSALSLALLGCGAGASGETRAAEPVSGGEQVVSAEPTPVAEAPASEAAPSVIVPAPEGEALLVALADGERLAEAGVLGPAMDEAYARAEAAARALGGDELVYSLSPADRAEDGTVFPFSLGGTDVAPTGDDPARRCAQARVIAWWRWPGMVASAAVIARQLARGPRARRAMGEARLAALEQLSNMRERLERDPWPTLEDAALDGSLITAGLDDALDELRRECGRTVARASLGLTADDLLRVAGLVRGTVPAEGDLAGPFELRWGTDVELVADAAEWARIRAAHARRSGVGDALVVQPPSATSDEEAARSDGETLLAEQVACDGWCCEIRGSMELVHGGGLYLRGACWVPAEDGRRLARIRFLSGM